MVSRYMSNDGHCLPEGGGQFYLGKRINKIEHEGIGKVVQSALSDLLTTSATHGTFSRPSMKRGLISIIKLMQFTIVRFF